MLRKRKFMARIIVVLCVAAISALSSVAYANEGGWGGERCGKHQQHNFKKIAKKLGLTEAQKTQAKAIYTANKDVVKPIFASLKTERKNLQALIHADIIDEAAIRAETAKIAGIQADLNVNRAKVDAEFRAILTPDQLAKLKTMKQKHLKQETAPINPPPTPSN